MRLDADDLVAEARSIAELDDFGGDSFREGLDAYCTSVRTEARLSELGFVGIHGTIVASLVNRLRVVDYATCHPDVAAEQVDAPLVVIGMFRAGTTFLSYLLERDPRNRALLRWEAGDSAPPPTPETLRTDRRVEAARVAGEMLEQLNPRIHAIHHEEPDGPTECIAVMSQDFKSLSWEAISNVPSYSAWLRGSDQRSAYEYHRRVLQVLQHGGVRGRWTLKSPHHAIALDALTSVYPDARLVLLHRDPVELCASVCSLITELSSCFTDADHREYIADHWVAMLEESISRIDAFRAANPDHPVIDVQYDTFVREPVETVASIYDALGDTLSDEVRDAMKGYVAANPKDSRGVHRYDIRDFGLVPGQIRERFADYVDRYGVPTH
jgi:sulfotransferase family protein